MDKEKKDKVINIFGCIDWRNDLILELAFKLSYIQKYGRDCDKEDIKDIPDVYDLIPYKHTIETVFDDLHIYHDICDRDQNKYENYLLEMEIER